MLNGFNVIVRFACTKMTHRQSGQRMQEKKPKITQNTSSVGSNNLQRCSFVAVFISFIAILPMLLAIVCRWPRINFFDARALARWLARSAIMRENYIINVNLSQFMLLAAEYFAPISRPNMRRIPIPLPMPFDRIKCLTGISYVIRAKLRRRKLNTTAKRCILS